MYCPASMYQAAGWIKRGPSGIIGTNRACAVESVDALLEDKVAKDLAGKGVLRFIKDTVEPAGSVLITDEFRSYRAVRSMISHAVINHSESYAEGDTHTNTIRILGFNQAFVVWVTSSL